VQIEAPSTCTRPTCTRPTCTRLGPPPFRGGGPQVRHRLARGGASVCVGLRQPSRAPRCASSLLCNALTTYWDANRFVISPGHDVCGPTARAVGPQGVRVLTAPVHGTGLRGTSCAVVRGRAVLCSRAVRYRARAGAASCSTGSCVLRCAVLAVQVRDQHCRNLSAGCRRWSWPSPGPRRSRCARTRLPRRRRARRAGHEPVPGRAACVPGNCSARQ